MAYEKNPKFTTPMGTFSWPAFTTPDTRFKDGGEWKTKIVLPASEEAEALVAKLEALHAESVATACKEQKKKSVKIADMPVTRDDAGNIIINAKQGASGISKKTQRPWKWVLPLFDAQGNAIKGTRPKVGNGSTGRISFEVQNFYTAMIGAGITLRLQAAQIVDLVEFGGGNAESYGFDKTDGYVAAEDDGVAAEETFKPTTQGKGTDGDF